jgi:hypothetical protein
MRKRRLVSRNRMTVNDRMLGLIADTTLARPEKLLRGPNCIAPASHASRVSTNGTSLDTRVIHTGPPAIILMAS